MKSSIIFLVLIIAIVGTDAHISAGACISSPVISDFSAAKYVGDWYEILHYPAIFENGLKCIRARYGLLNATAVSVHNDAKNAKTGANSTTDGYGVIENLQAPNQISVFFPFQGNAPQPYNVWLTDYTSYTLVYACKQIIPNLLRFETAWILSRQPVLDEVLVAKLVDFYKQKGLDVSIFEKTDQTGCVY